MSVSRHHADWLSLVEVSGPFVSLPVIMRVFPQGLEPRDPAQAKALRSAYEEWNENPTAPGRQRAWIRYVLTAVLGYPQDQITEGQSLPAGLETNMPEMGEILRPDFALVSPNGRDTTDQTQLLITSYPTGQALDKPVIGRHWKATPATRMMELLHGAGVTLGLVTNGEHWMLVYAPRGETTGYASWYGNLWLDEPITLRAFHSLLGVRRFFGVATDSTLLALLKESAQDQQEVTDQLGYQVREAVEVLVQSFDALDKESGRKLLKGVAEITLYEAALTIMMRLVFLFSAEERGLLHLGKPLYDDNYAVSTLQEQLQELADRYGEEVLERRLDAWARLLATFRAVYGGVQHQDLLMQAYGGSLFDPDCYPFLEGRTAGTAWHTSVAEPLAVNNRVVLHLLNSLQRLRTKVGTGGMTETRRVSFRALGVEQIGHVYEGLLDHTAVRATEPILGIKGTRSKEPEIPLSTLESLLAQGTDKFFDYLKEATGRTTIAPIKRAFEEGSLLDEHKMLIACNQDEVLITRLRPFIGLIRDDSFERPLIILQDSVYVTAGTARRSTGTHYTPPSLTEPIVQHTLEPLVYEGPAEGWPREQWKLKSPKAILDLKVCDMTMGSGAFLVQTCRYMAERLVEAWENEEKKHPGKMLITPDGKFSEGSPSERLVPEDTDERIAIACRVVADRCLYGVDINPMAVEMAKLSIWLITVDANRPFTFLDHAFKCGDSLLGITLLDQLENFSLRPGMGKQQTLATLNLRQNIEDAKKKREALEAMPSDTPEQIAVKMALYAEAEEAVAKLNATADLLIAIELKGLKGRAYKAEREVSAENMMIYWTKDLSELQNYASQQLNGHCCLHWALAYPEIINNGGFHAFVGNPPFMGGLRLSEVLGDDYNTYLMNIYGAASKKADLCAYFFQRSLNLTNRNSAVGLIATNTISQGVTRRSSLDLILDRGCSIYRSQKSFQWPGQAAVIAALVHFTKQEWKGYRYCDDKICENINALLDADDGTLGLPYKLYANSNICYQGVTMWGDEFFIKEQQAQEFMSISPLYGSVVKPAMGGKELNTNPYVSPTRWAINFGEMDRFEAEQYKEVFSYIETHIREKRSTLDRDKYERVVISWWKYFHSRSDLFEGIQKKGLQRILARCRVSDRHMLAFIDTNIIYTDALVVFLFQSFAHFALLQSSFHDSWVRVYASSLKNDVRYGVSDCFETFPFPLTVNQLESPGAEYYEFRSQVMKTRQEGLTEIYNKFNNPSDKSSDIEELRKRHVNVDKAVAIAYGLNDIKLDHGFQETKQGIRFTISATARLYVLNHLLTLNHRRYDEEVAAGLHDKISSISGSPGKRGRKKKKSDDQVIMDI